MRQHNGEYHNSHDGLTADWEYHYTPHVHIDTL